MPRVKTKEYEFNDTVLQVHYNCSTSGVFSANLSYDIAGRLGLNGKLEGKTLSELESIVNKAFIAYKNAKTSYSVHIGISFGVNGKFSKTPEGQCFEGFHHHNNPYKLQISFSRVDSVVGFDFRILICENRDGKLSYFNAKEKPERPDDFYKNFKEVEGFYKMSATDIERGEKLIAYSETALEKLGAIVSQFQKASEFLYKLVQAEELNLLLTTNNVALLQTV